MIFQNRLSFQKFYVPEMQNPSFSDGVNSLSSSPQNYRQSPVALGLSAFPTTVTCAWSVSGSLVVMVIAFVMPFSYTFVAISGKANDAIPETDVAVLDLDKVELLKAVFWDMTKITTWTITVEHPVEGDADAWIETVLGEQGHFRNGDSINDALVAEGHRLSIPEQVASELLLVPPEAGKR